MSQTGTGRVNCIIFSFQHRNSHCAYGNQKITLFPDVKVHAEIQRGVAITQWFSSESLTINFRYGVYIVRAKADLGNGWVIAVYKEYHVLLDRVITALGNISAARTKRFTWTIGTWVPAYCPYVHYAGGLSRMMAMDNVYVWNTAHLTGMLGLNILHDLKSSGFKSFDIVADS